MTPEEITKWREEFFAYIPPYRRKEATGYVQVDTLFEIALQLAEMNEHRHGSKVIPHEAKT